MPFLSPPLCQAHIRKYGVQGVAGFPVANGALGVLSAADDVIGYVVGVNSTARVALDESYLRHLSTQRQ